MRTVLMATVFLVAASLVAGCGAAHESTVSGTVTYDGVLIEEGSIAFIPADGNGPSAGGAIKDGKFTATKVTPGMANVRISGAKVTSKKKMYDDPNSPWVSTSIEMLPAKYNEATELQYDVKPGPQQKDFELPK